MDVDQLIKHYLGLRKNYCQYQNIILLYLFWEPKNAKGIKEFEVHREEIMQFTSQVKGSSVQFITKSYPELWDEWDDHINQIIYEAEEGGHWAEVPSITGCATQGETFGELLINLYEAIDASLSVDVKDIKLAENDKVLEIAV